MKAALPLKAGLTGQEIQYEARGKITNGKLGKVVLDYELQEADLDFSLDQSNLNFSGPLRFSGVPLTLDWTTHLSGPEKGYADFTVDAPKVSGAEISALGFAVNEYLEGSVALKSKAKLSPGGLITMTVESDFNNAKLEVPQIHWHKARGEGGSIDFSLSIEKNHLHAKDINIELGHLKTDGDVQIDVKGPLISLSLEQLSLSYAQLKGLKLERDESKNLIFTLQGGEASLEPFLSADEQGADPLQKQVAVQSKAVVQELRSTGLTLEIGESKLDKLYINKETYLDNIEFSGRREGQGWQEIKVSGRNPLAGDREDTDPQFVATEKLGSGEFSIAFGPLANGQYPLHIEVEDLGSLVSAVKGRDIMKSGYLVLDGDSQGPLFTGPLQADLQLNYFTLKEAPAISSVLNMASLTQIISTFRQTGLAFNSASGSLELDESRLSIEDVHLKGGSLGVVIGGWVDLKQQNLALNGVVVPLSNLNKLVGKIPLFGRIVVGKDGHGIMAVDYTVTGTISDPVASIRKEALTPDLLENVTGTNDGSGDQTPR